MTIAQTPVLGMLTVADLTETAVYYAGRLNAATDPAEVAETAQWAAAFATAATHRGATAEDFTAARTAAQAKRVKDGPTAYTPPLAEDGMPEPGPDKTTTIRLDLGSVQGEAEIFISDDAAATATIAFGITTPDDCADWTVADAERVLAGLPVFEAQLRGLITKLASYQGGAR
jgi:hypothetical protein